MLVFISIEDYCNNTKYKFQYILCWYLSDGLNIYGTLNLLFQYILCWYLSRQLRKNLTKYKRFQYILCWYLSLYLRLALSFIYKFQYILCWYLSNEFKAFSFLPFLVYPCIIYHFPFFYQPFRNFFNSFSKVLQTLILSIFQAFLQILRLVKILEKDHLYYIDNMLVS